MRKKIGEDMKLITVHLTKSQLDYIDKLISENIFANKAEIIRYSLLRLMIEINPLISINKRME